MRKGLIKYIKTVTKTDYNHKNGLHLRVDGSLLMATVQEGRVGSSHELRLKSVKVKLLPRH